MNGTFFLIAVCNWLVPKRHQLVLQSFPDVDDHTVAILRWLERNPGKHFPIIILTGGSRVHARRKLHILLGPFSEKLSLLDKKSTNAIWSYWRSDLVMFTHGLYGFFPSPPRQRVINLWHGMPLKTIWRAAKDSPVPPCSYLLSTSEIFSTVLAAASGLDRSKIRTTGLPRNDLLLSGSAATKSFRKTVATDFDRLTAFLPTYRQSKVGYIAHDGEETANTLLMSDADVRRLCDLLHQTRTLMFVKPHPMSVHYGQDIALHHNLRIVSDGWLLSYGVSLYEALSQVDLLISDISSLYVDFLVTDRPALCFFPDIDKYRRTRRFLLEPVEDYLPSRVCTTPDELFVELHAFLTGHDLYAERRARLRALLNPQSDPSATGRLFDLLRDNHDTN